MSPRVTAMVFALGAAAASGADEAPPEGTTDSLAKIWDAWRGSGNWRTNYFGSSRSLDDEVGFLGATAELQVLPAFSESVEGLIELRATNPALGEGGDTQARWLEAYVLVRLANADLRIGKQIIAWGRADGINPTDNISPRDFTVMLPFEDDQRFGTGAMKLDLYVAQDYTLSILAAPFFEPSQVPLPPSFNRVEIVPAHTLSNMQGGIKLDKVGEGFDWSLSHYRGFSLLPTVRILEDGASVELHYDRINATGADFARNFGRFGVRGEVAYIDTTDDTGDDPAVRNSGLFWIVGVDRTFYEDLNVNLQYFQYRTRGFHDPRAMTDPLSRSTAMLNAAMHSQPERVSDGISFRISNRWMNQTLEAEMFAAIDFSDDNAFVRPMVTYAFSDRWKGTVGAEIYAGAAGTRFGSLEANRGGFVELRYGF